MSHVVVQNSQVPLKQAIVTGQISKNAIVTGYKGHPCPTLAALISSGQIDLSKPSNSLSFSGFGGE